MSSFSFTFLFLFHFPPLLRQRAFGRSFFPRFPTSNVFRIREQLKEETYHLAISHSYGQYPINGGVHGKSAKNVAIFQSYFSLLEGFFWCFRAPSRRTFSRWVTQNHVSLDRRLPVSEAIGRLGYYWTTMDILKLAYNPHWPIDAIYTSAINPSNSLVQWIVYIIYYLSQRQLEG